MVNSLPLYLPYPPKPIISPQTFFFSLERGEPAFAYTELSFPGFFAILCEEPYLY